MTLEIEIDPCIAAWLEEEAARRGRSPREIAREVLAEAATAPAVPEVDFAALRTQLPRRSAEARRQLAREQGASLAATPEQLSGSFWPEEESTEEFLAQLRAWRQDAPQSDESPLE